MFDQLFVLSVIEEAALPYLSITDPDDATNETMSETAMPSPKYKFKVCKFVIVTFHWIAS